MELTKKERLFLYNQYEILKTLNKNDVEMVKTYDCIQKVILNGYASQYDELISEFSDDLPNEVTSFVYDVLNLYRTLIFSFDDLQESEKVNIDKRDISFQGFDGNEEGDYCIFSEFVLKDMDKYREIYDGGKCTFNSHIPRIEKYLTMLEKWKRIRKSEYDRLTLDQIKLIIGK